MSLTSFGDDLERFCVMTLSARLNCLSTAALEANTAKIQAANFDRIG